MLKKLALLGAAASGVWGHAVMLEPVPRKTGPAHAALCGAEVTRRLEMDRAGPIENAMKWADADYNCNAYLCRGYQFEDNSNNVQALSAGDVVDIKIDLIAGHRPGYSNVSIVDLGENKLIGDALISWDDWPTREEGWGTEFSVTIPDGLESTCDEAGKCAIQWFWYAVPGSQTYESCIDFTV